MWHFLMLVVLKDSQKLKEEDEMLFHMKLLRWEFGSFQLFLSLELYIWPNKKKEDDFSGAVPPYRSSHPISWGLPKC